MNELIIVCCMLSWNANAILLLEKIRLFKIRLYKIRLFNIRLFKIRLFKIRLFKIRLFKKDCDKIQTNLKVEKLTIFLIIIEI